MLSYDRPGLIYIVTGEASGDLIGGRLMRSLKTKSPGLRFAGIGGETMTQEGLVSLFPARDLSVMGFFEILPHLPRLIKRFQQVKADILAQKPDVVVTIDSPGFNFRLARALKGEISCPLVHYTAPSVWAWKPGRAQKMSKVYDHLLALFGFEPPYFKRAGLACTFVGHPLMEKKLSEFSETDFRVRHDIGEKVPLLCCLPGSRESEVSALLPCFKEAILLLRDQLPTLRVVCPTTPPFQQKINRAFSGKVPLIFPEGEKEKYLAMRASQAALAASGTVSLELALTQTPMVIGYRMNPLTYFLAKRLVKTPYICLVNILHQADVVPEFVQDKCTPQNLCDALFSLMSASQAAIEKQRLLEIPSLLQVGDRSPSDVAAGQIFRVVAASREKKAPV